MTREKIIADAIEAAMEVAINSPHNNNAVTLFDCALATAAAAVLDLCGPKELVWSGTVFPYCATSFGLFKISQDDQGYYVVLDGPVVSVVAHSLPTIKAAQAAAQAHADAAHWAGTKLGDV